MASTASQDRLKALKAAADTWFSDQRRYLEAEYDFLDQISKTRGGTVGLQDANAAGASAILANSINDYLGAPLEPQK